MPNTIGYLTIFDTTTLVDHSNKRALDVVDNTSGVNAPVTILPNGTKVYYNGTSDATTTPGRARQRIINISAARTFYETLVGKLGNYGQLTLAETDHATNPTTHTCYAILMSVRDITPILRTRDKMWIEVEFELLTDWT